MGESPAFGLTALRVYDRFVEPLSEEDAQTYHREAIDVAVALGVPPGLVPADLAQLRLWMDDMVATRRVRVTDQARAIARTVLVPDRRIPRIAWDAAHLVSLATLREPIRRDYGIAWSPARDRGMEPLSAAVRRMLSFVPAPLRHVPHARRADRRVRQALSVASTR